VRKIRPISGILKRVFRRPAEVHARDRRVYQALIDHLYSDVVSVAGGIVGGMALAYFCHIADPSGYFLLVMMLMGIIGIVRMATMAHYRRHLLGREKPFRVIRAWELIYGVSAISFAAVFGGFGLLVFVDPATEHLRALLLASVVGYAGGIAGRNAGRPFVALGQVVASCAPMLVHTLSNPSGAALGIAMMLAIYMFTLAKIVRGLNAIVSRAFTTERDVGEINQRLEGAITHMMSGLCMVDATGRIKIINQRFRSLLDLPDVPYQRLHEVLLAALPMGTLRHSEIAEIQACLTDGRDLVLKFITERGKVLLLKAATTPTADRILTIDDVTEQTRAAADIERMAKFDALTGLANRALIQTTLSDALLGAAAGRGKMGLLLLDLDRFKEINDTLGHMTGDQLLVKVGERLKELAPRDACIGRLGGDEFVVILPGRGRRECLLLAQRITKAIAKPIGLGGHVTNTTLIRAADIALYSQKGKGRNGVDIFDAEMSRQLERRRRLEQDLGTALRENGIDLAFQPIVSADDGRIVACEALARWRHPEFGPIAPDVFVPLAESTGLIAALGRHVLTRACREAMQWPEHVRVSVNVSTIQFRNRDQLFTDIWLALSASGLPARRLDLEVTESVLIDDAEGMFQIIEALRQMDITVSLDDFGTGYSSLAYVQRYRFDKIKLDKAFANSIETDRTSRATIAALANIARATGSRLLLEGVETEAQAKIAAAHGVNEMQGYLFSRPVPAADIPFLIAGKSTKKAAA
jgi:predicted signal transduction protein with EAL and GGDEF domain